MAAIDVELELAVDARSPSLRRTLAVQLLLCAALYGALSIGAPQRGQTDLYFMSVRGGERASGEQARLIDRMEKTAKLYKVKFVIDIAELGEDDPLMKNATLQFPAGIPWYATHTLHGQGVGNLSRSFELSYQRELGIISVDTGSLKDLLHEGKLDRNVSDHLNLIRKALSETQSNWHIVVGFHPMTVCEANQATETIKFNKPLHDLFLEKGVDVYLSSQGCAGYFYHNDGIAYLSNPGHTGRTNTGLSINVGPDYNSQICDGFLLHRVSPLEITSYFLDTEGKTVLKTGTRHKGRETYYNSID